MILASRIRKIELVNRQPKVKKVVRCKAEIKLKNYLEEKYGRSARWVNHILTNPKRIIMN